MNSTNFLPYISSSKSIINKNKQTHSRKKLSEAMNRPRQDTELWSQDADTGEYKRNITPLIGEKK